VRGLQRALTPGLLWARQAVPGVLVAILLAVAARTLAQRLAQGAATLKKM